MRLWACVALLAAPVWAGEQVGEVAEQVTVEAARSARGLTWMTQNS